MTRSQVALLVVLVLLVPMLLFANAWQSYRTYQLDRAIRTVKAEHARLLNENTRLVVGIASLRSPARIREIVMDQLEMRPLKSAQIFRIRVARSGDSNGF